MLNSKDIADVLQRYRIDSAQDVTIAVLGGHSALDVCHGAKKLGFKTLAVCQKGREKTYSEYFKTRDGKGCIDEVMLLEQFSDVLLEDVQEELRKKKVIFIHNRYFWVYFSEYSRVEKDFRVPLFGSRGMLRMEERDAKPNQYDLLRKAGIRTPEILRQGGEMMSDETLKEVLNAHPNRPKIVKASEEERSYERDFFVVMDFEQYELERTKRNREKVDTAVIEEFVIGPQINFNYFYSPLSGELELMGTDTRRQTNLDGFLRLNAREQMVLLEQGFKPSMVENGHIAVTTKESILEKMFELGEQFVNASKKMAEPGIIGPFALQGAYVSELGKEDFVVFDVSMRIPGSPGTRFTPHTGYLWGESISYGERIAMEIRRGIEEGRLEELLT